MAASQKGRGTRIGSASRQPLDARRVLVVDADAPSALLIRQAFETLGARVEIAETRDEALDVLGNASSPVDLVAMSIGASGFASRAILTILRRHHARIAVVLYGQPPPERTPKAAELAGAAAFVPLSTSAAITAAGARALSQAMTVRAILDARVVPTLLDHGAAHAIYGADPGDPFPLTFRP